MERPLHPNNVSAIKQNLEENTKRSFYRFTLAFLSLVFLRFFVRLINLITFEMILFEKGEKKTKDIDRIK